MRKRLLKIILLISIVSIGISSCQKEYNERNGGISAESNKRGPKGPKNNRPPVANAGADQVITLPSNSVNLNGSATDPDNNITSYQWTKISGPSSFTIANPSSVQTQVTNLVAGVYQFELKVTDQFALNDKDVVQVTVLDPSPPSPPPCTICKIVFVSARDGNNEIYTSNTDGSNITRVTYDPADDDQPAWSPDGTRIAFIRNFNLFIMNADGSNVVQRTFSGGCGPGLTWSPDGTKIAFSEYTESGMGIYVVSATGGSPFLLFEVAPGGVYFAEVMQPAWSPDGTKIALVTPTFLDRNGEQYTYDIYTINSDGTGFTALTYFNSGSDNFDSPSWSPGGAKLAVVFNWSQVGVMNSDGSGFTLLTSGFGRTSWSADGTTIVYNSSSGSMLNVSWVAADGSAGGTIVTNGWNADWQH
jgi:Tol biopolymer transport system component